MNDSQLLDLLDKAKEKQRGPKGETGVGIERVEQFDDTGFTLRLTDGSFKRIALPTAKDGEPGPVGPAGPAGEQGSPGRPGRDGVAGKDGAPGAQGPAGSFVDAAVVNPSGELLLSLSTGEMLNVGRVVGPAGATGEQGPTGLPGSAGRDGEAVLSGPRAPQQDDGKEGDHWIDISSAEYGFYKKSGEGWNKLSTLRQPTPNKLVGAPGGGGGGGSGGGGVDLPPVIIDKNPPVKGNNKGPIRQGDLWFDSDQLALYVATKDSSNNIVWVISIPGVTGVPGTQTTTVRVVYPKAVDGEEWTNPLTQVTYRYNEPKKQWINVNGGIVSVQDKRPATPQTGSLWFDTEENELTLYLFDGSVWVPASPPVSLDGIEDSIASVDAELMKVNANIAMNKRDIDEAILDIKDEQSKQDEAIEYNSRECTQLRSRIGDVEMSQSIQDGRLDKLEKEEDETAARLFGSPYVFKKDKEADDLASGEFTYDSDWNWYAHRYDAAGDRIGVSSDNTFTTDGMIKVYKHNGAINLICIMHRYDSCKCGQDENDHMKWKRKSSIYTHTEWLEDGQTYFLSDGFLLPQ